MVGEIGFVRGDFHRLKSAAANQSRKNSQSNQGICAFFFLKQALKILGSIGLLIIAVFFLQRSFNPRPSDAQAGPPAGLGQVVAEQAASAISEAGQIVVIDLPLDSVDSQTQRKAFEATIGRHKKIKIDHKDFSVGEVGMMGNISFEQLSAVVNSHPEARVVVSFLKVNWLTDAQWASLSKPDLKLVVVGWNERTVRAGIDKGVIAAAVMSRELLSMPTDNPKDAHQWFDRYYNLVTPRSGAEPATEAPPR